MLSAVLDLLSCPLCRSSFGADGGSLICATGHAFDIARQGYVALLTGDRAGLHADTADMLGARDRVMSAGVFDPVRAAVAHATAGAATQLEVGAGTGHYLADSVGRTVAARGIGMDLSKISARRVARLDPRVGAVAADAWSTWPVRDRVIEAVLSVFAPRNIAECHRVLTPHGRLVMVTPGPAHLAELTEPMGMIGVDDDKPRRIDSAMAGRLVAVHHEHIRYPVPIDRELAADLVRMGPSAFHRSDHEVADRAAALPGAMEVTVSVRLSIYRPRSSKD